MKRFFCFCTRIVLLLSVCFGLFSCVTVISGRISVKGNEPHTYLALTTEQGLLFEVQGPMRELLWKQYQGSEVSLKVRIVKEPQEQLPGLLEALELLE